jgi:hypothetical protein
MFQLLVVRTGKSQNVILTGLLRREFARYGISAKAVAAAMAEDSEPISDEAREDLFWENERRSLQVLEYIRAQEERQAAERQHAP